MREEINKLNTRVDGIDDRFKSVLDKMAETSSSIQELTNELKLDRKDYEISRKANEELKADNKEIHSILTTIKEDIIPLKLIQAQFIEQNKNVTDMKLKVLGGIILTATLSFLGGKLG
tara:strand:+ start:1743 stop:2096 length:354 start_codon:yes stop_codon:yes gene_type:complete